MTTKKFNLLQLFSILDGRLSTTIDDVYEILNHITRENLMTHHLPVAMKYLQEVKPLWFILLKNEIDTIKMMYDDDFMKIIEAINKDFNFEYDIPQLTVEEKKEFEDFMIKNSLLK